MVGSGWRGLLPDDVVKEATSPIFHYTSADGLVGLIQSMELWATEASGMNDVAEVRQGWDYIRRWLRKESDSHSIFKLMRSTAKSKKDDDDSASSVRSREGIFICCASQLRDDASQWRLYGGGAKGYCVQLDPQVPFVAIARGERPPEHVGPPTFDSLISSARDMVPVTPWLPVLYSSHDKDLALQGLTANAMRDWEMWNRGAEGTRMTEDDFDAGMQDLRDQIGFDLGRLAQLMKSSGFSGEREVRIIATDRFVRTANFRGTAQGVVRYSRLTATTRDAAGNRVAYENELLGHKTLPVMSIRMGPLIHAENNTATIRDLLRSNGLDNSRVLSSKVPLRH
jgi:hypothetical protein